MYRVQSVGDDVDVAIAALPSSFLAAFSELRVALELAPWTTGRPYVAVNPSGSRSATFGPGGRGLVIHAVEDSERRTVWLWLVTIAPEIESG